MTLNEPPPQRPVWDPLPPERLPRPTYCPAGMALGAALVFWGIISSWIILLVGIGLFTVMLSGWIAEICHERKKY
jgi:hypothetical protein